MTNGELKARIEELNAVAEHVPAGVLAARLLSTVEDAYTGDLRTLQIARQIERGEHDAEIRRRLQAALESAEQLAAHRLEEIGRLEDVLREERIRAEEKAEAEAKPEPPEIFDPGIPQRDADLAMPERPEPSPMERVEEDMRQFPDDRAEEPEPEPDGKPSKPCNRCGETKPLSAFPKDASRKDNRKATCSPCDAAYQRERREARKKADATKDAEQERIEAGAREIRLREGRPSPKADSEARLCARGRMCLAFPEIGQPSPLAGANTGNLCYRCEGARRKTTLDQVRQFPIVRRSTADREASA